MALMCLKLYNIEEKALVKWIIQLHAARLLPCIAMIIEMANHLMSKQSNNRLSETSTSVGRIWVYRFTHCHLQLQSVYGQKLGMECFWTMDEELFKDRFKTWKEVVDKYQILPENTYNMDKKSCISDVAESAKVLVPSNATT